MMKSIRALQDLSGRTALITGGAGHIGGAVAAGLIELGAKVAIVDRDPRQCASMVSELGERAFAVPADIADEASTREAVRVTVSQAGGLDIVVHCAAFVGTTELPGWAVPFEQQTVAAWDRALRVNLTAAFVLAQESAPILRARNNGSLILFGSIYGMVGPDMRLYTGTEMANPAAYGTSKGGLLQLTRYLAAVLAPSVRVNAISPGGVWRQQPTAFRERYEARTPLQRMATEEDIKGAVAFLASDLSAYVTGQNLIVDGGWTTW